MEIGVMKKLKLFAQRFLAYYRKVNLVDRYLIIVMIILWIHCCLVLMYPRDYFADMQNVDVMIRSTISSVFGYFLSTNFLRPKLAPPPSPPEPSPAKPEDNTSLTTLEPGQAPRPKTKPKARYGSWEKDLQVRIIAYIGISSLLLLVFRRQINLIIPNPLEAIAANAQSMRDLTSGSIGFLIGHVTEEK